MEKFEQERENRGTTFGGASICMERFEQEGGTILGLTSFYSYFIMHS